MHTAFVDFKQAYDTIPRQELWQHLQHTRMLASCFFVHYSRHVRDADEYILKDGEKTARVYPNTGVKQGCHLSPLHFSVF